MGLSHYPLIYSLLGGTGVILFWRGIWHTADYLEEMGGILGIIFSDLGSMILGVTILLSTGLFVSIFIGDSIIMSGIKKDKKLIEKTEEELIEEAQTLEKVESKLEQLDKKLDKKQKEMCEIVE